METYILYSQNIYASFSHLADCIYLA